MWLEPLRKCGEPTTNTKGKGEKQRAAAAAAAGEDEEPPANTEEAYRWGSALDEPEHLRRGGDAGAGEGGSAAQGGGERRGIVALRTKRQEGQERDVHDHWHAHHGASARCAPP